MKFAFETKTEISRFPPPLIHISRRSRPSITSRLLDYKAGDGTIFKASGQARRSFSASQQPDCRDHSDRDYHCVVVPLSYIFARLEFRFKAVLLTSILLSVSLPPVSTLIPFYTLYVQLGLTGTLTGLIIVS